MLTAKVRAENPAYKRVTEGIATLMAAVWNNDDSASRLLDGFQPTGSTMMK